MTSVVVTTYQHAAFIEQCIQGILMQETTFPVEILIGEDESTDGTRAICQRLAAEHPERIRLFLRSRKDVMHIMGRPTGRANWLHLLGEAKGKYIALCEGDDHWTDPHKLQKQVAALEADPEAVACFTNAYNERDGIRTEYLDGNYTKVPGPRVYQQELVNAQGLPTCTIVFRRQAMLPLPRAIHHSPTGDTLLYAHLSNFGHFIYLAVFSAVRRMHPGGIHSMKDQAHQCLVTLRNLPYLDEVSHHRHHALIETRRRKETETGWVLAMEAHNMELARICWWPMARMRERMGWNLPTTARNYLKAYWPRTERVIGKIWDRMQGRP